MVSFSKRLSIALFIPVALTCILSLIFIGYTSDQIIANEAGMTAEHTLEATVLEIEKTLLDITEDTRDLKFEPVIKDNPNIVSYRYIDVPDDRYLNCSWYNEVISNAKELWTEPYESLTEPGTYICSYCYPVHDENGVIRHIAMSDVTLPWLSEKIHDKKFIPYENSFTVLFSKDLVCLASSRHNENIRFGMDKARLDNVQLIPGKESMATVKVMGKECLMVSGVLDNGWTAVTVSPYRDVFKSVFRMRPIILSVCILALLLIFLITYKAISINAKPLVNFSAIAKKIARGDFSADLPDIKHDDEVRELRDSFDYMQKNLKTYINDLQEATAAKERFESELVIANKIQQDLLPPPFEPMENLSISALLTPAKAVGGDLYDYHLDDDRLYFSVGDVSGKGVPASLLMSSTQSSFRFNRDLDISMEKMTTRMNRYLSSHNFEGMFVTMFVACLDLVNYRMDFCNAGHNRIVICPPDGNSYFLDEKPNFVLGIMGDFPYEAQHVDLQKGTSLILYSDGVTEAEDRNKNLYGDERLLKWSRKPLAERNSDNFSAASLLADVQSFTDGNEQNDDITIMIINL